MMSRFCLAALSLAAMACCHTTQAQTVYPVAPSMHSASATITPGDNCGRGISHNDALGLWSNYCNESCGYQGNNCNSGCGLFSGRLRRGGRGCCDTGCGTTTDSCAPANDCCDPCCSGRCFRLPRPNCCSFGCFGYPSSCCSTGNSCCEDTCCGRTRRFRLFGRRGCDDQCGCDPCDGVFGDCCGGLFSRLRARREARKCCRTRRFRLFNRSRCCCGDNGAYFQEAVGYEYGTSGMQSAVHGITDDTLEPAESVVEPSGDFEAPDAQPSPSDAQVEIRAIEIN